MPGAKQTLADIVGAGPEAALKETAQTLAQAFVPGRPAAAEELRGFILAVQAWLDEGGAPFRERLRWVESQVDPWLRQLNPDAVSAMAATVSNIRERIRLLAMFFGTPMRHLLWKALEDSAAAFAGLPAQVTPEEQSSREEAALRLTDMAAALAARGEVKGLARILSLLPVSLTEQVFARAGQLIFFEYCVEEWARALPLAEPGVADAFAAAFGRNESVRLRHLLEELVEHARRPAHPVLPKGPSRREVEEWFVTFRRALGKRSPQLQRRVEAFTTSLWSHERELAAILAAYLNARPINHEEVFDLFSAHSEKRREGHPPSDWKKPSVMTSISGSMRSRSLFSGPGASPKLDPADFDWKPAMRGVAEPVLRELILAQRNPEFALSYIEQVWQAGHPEFHTLCENLSASAVFRNRLRETSRTMAAVVLINLEKLRHHAPALKVLFSSLFTELLPEVPVGFLRGLMHDVIIFDEGLSELMQRELKHRFPKVESVNELEDLLECASDLLSDAEVVAGLEKVALPALCPDKDADAEPLKDWLYVVTRLTEMRVGEPAKRLLACLPRELFGRMYPLEPFGFKDYDTEWFCLRRQALKNLFVEEWARHEPEQVQKALQDHLERDFNFWWRCHFPEREHNEDVTASPVYGWLQMVATHCPEKLGTYLSSALHHARASRGPNHVGPNIQTAARLVNAWLLSHGETAGEVMWKLLLERFVQLAEDDYESAAAVAAVELPGLPGELAAFRKQAVEEVRKRMHAAGSTLWQGSLGELRNLLSKESPELLALLSSS
ncbi:hypothetical protein [Hyalangium versicolor]|uniref:hypothetical protein n=1 Tax=Hyalangium versicolor TaxID=2861190 RepID=UPI001CCC0861|nr:hypothetical protein [Hyalangium versicolor]